MDEDEREALKRRICWAIDQADDDETDRMERDRGYTHDWLQTLIGWIANLMSILTSIFGRGGCFLTTAAVRYLGLSDDCDVLTSLRQFRDSYLLDPAYPHRVRLVADYYRAAPRIVQALERRSDVDAIWRSVYEKSARVASLIEFDRHEQAYDELINGMRWIRTIHVETLASNRIVDTET